MSPISLGKRIRELRTKLRISQVELAKGICTPSMVSQIESDRARPSYKILSSIAEKLEIPLEKLLVEVDINADYMSNYKMAQAMIAAKDFTSAIPLLQEIMQIRRGSISQDELRVDLAECYLHTGEFSKANRLIQRVHESAILRRDGQMIIRIYRNFGLIEFHTKRYQLAIHHWQKALVEMESMELQDPLLKAHILADIGQAHERLGNIKEAIGFYTDAAAVYQDADRLEDMAALYMNLGRTYKQLFNYDSSIEYSQRAITLYETLENSLMKVKVEILSAVSFAKEGREQEAIHLLENAIHRLQELRKHEDLGFAYIELANIQTSLGELEKAQESCQIAQGLLPEQHPYQALGQRIIGSIEQQRGNYEEAMRRYKMAADNFKSLGEIGKWAETMESLSHVMTEQNDYPSAYQLMKELRSQTRQTLHERGIVL